MRPDAIRTHNIHKGGERFHIVVPDGGASRVQALSLLALIILCGSVLVLSEYSGQPGIRSGTMGSIEEFRAALASYNLSEGEKMHYEWESNYPVRIVITTDPSHPQLAEYLNVTGTGGGGEFVSPTSSKYYLQVTFVDIPIGSEARIDYAIYKVTAFSESMAIGEPLILGGLTVSLAGLLLWSWRLARADVRRAPWSFWQFFSADYRNWIAIVAGAAILTFQSVQALADANHLDQNTPFEMLGSIGGVVLVWGLIFGLWISHSNYKASRRQRV